ncbi:caspase family protein [uncultured Pelagimonas sp.]|uniref:caspase family protein n=1 Tax=uncultured Pelagimonas sp. TaxID=1618102 RepID=UPI0026095383|nr:caspase family protein [uncultured Pelagimonas sp.]
MAKRLLVSIGVHAPIGADELPGVEEAVKGMAAYAQNNPTFDDAIVFIDAQKPVTAQNIRDKLTSDVLKNRPRVVVHFCGHGAQLNGNEIWYLSGGLNDWMERVNVIQFRDMILSHGAKQVCIFSDACQTPAYDTADGTPVLVRGTRRRNTFRADMFRATLPGKSAFAAADGGPLFSNTVLDVLGKDPPPMDALSKTHLEKHEFVVSSHSLAEYVEKELPDKAAGVRKSQYAAMQPGLNPWLDDYLKVDPEQVGPEWHDLLPKPTFGLQGLTRMSDLVSLNKLDLLSDSDKADLMEATTSEWRQVFWDESRSVAESAFDQGMRLVVHVGSKELNQHELICHLPDGQRAFGVKLEAEQAIGGHYWGFDVATSAAVFQAGAHCVPIQPGSSDVLNMTFALSDTGVHALGWHEVGLGGFEGKRAFDPMRALKGLVEGTLRPRHVGFVAAELRLKKHSDPLYGIVAAYLYDQVGDVASIRRMCYFYAEFEQEIPFDIAMLARVPWRLTPSGFVIDLPEVEHDILAMRDGLPDYAWRGTEAVVHCPVAGFAPVFLAGWGRVETILEEAERFSVLAKIRRHSAPSPFPSFVGHDTLDVLIEMMNGVYSNDN